MLRLSTAMRPIIYASLASVGTAVLYSGYGLWNVRGTHLSPDVIVWVLVVSATVFPVALASSLAATLMERSPMPAKSLATLIVLAIAPCISAVIYISYMSAIFPATNWSRAWWFPMVASVAAIGLTWLKLKMPYRK